MATGTIYNHRSLQPAGRSATGQSTTQPSGSARLGDSLDAIKQEFESMSSELELIRSQKDEVEGKAAAQVAELNIIRRSLFELENQHTKVRQQYEDEISRLRAELSSIRHATHPAGPVGLSSLPSNSASSLDSSHGATSSAAYNDSQQLSNGKSRDVPMDSRGKDAQDRGRELRESRPRDFSDHDREREVDRLADQRDPKRLRKRDPSVTTPRLPSSHTLYGPSGTAQGYLPSEALGRGFPLPPLNNTPKTDAPGPFDDLTYHNVPPEYRREGTEWFAVFNPKVKQALDVSLVHSFLHTSVVCCVQFSQDGRFLATGCNRTAQIYDTRTGIKVCVLEHESEAHTGDLYIRSVRFSPDGKLLATGAEDRQIRIWDIARKRIRHIFDGHQQEIYSLDFSMDGRLIVSGSGDKTTRIWDMTDYSCKVFTITDVVDSDKIDAGVTSVSISPNSQYVAAGSLDNVIRIWDVATGTLLDRLRGHLNSVYSVAFTPDGKGLLTGSLDKSLKLWDVSHLGSGVRSKAEPSSNGSLNGTGLSSAGSMNGDRPAISPCVMDFVGHKDYVLSVSMSSDSRWVVSGSKDRCVHVWDSQTAALQFMLQGHKNSVISLDLNSANELLATGSGDSYARIWGLKRLAA